MSKVEIRTLESVTANDATATALINSNFEALQQAIENTVSRDGSVPNYMDSNLDLNSYKIINAGNPENDHDVVTKKYFEDSIGDAASYATQAVTAANAAASSAQSAAVSASEAISTLAQAEAVIQQAASDAAEAAEGNIENYIETTVKPEIQLSVEAAEASLNSYVDGTVKPSLQTYVDQAQENANSAATSMEQAALSATSASNYASNASSDADNAAESAGLAANSAAAAAESEGKAAEYLQQVSDKITTVEGSIGDIGFAPFGIDEAQNKRRYLNGQVISQAQFVSFTNKIKSAIELYPSLAISETNWQAEVTNSPYGICGKFVIDDTLGTIRLPKYPDWSIREVGQAGIVGNGMALGLTDGTKLLGLHNVTTNGQLAGSETNYGNNVGVASTNQNGLNLTVGITTDPEKSGMIADLVNANTEDKLQGKWFIQVATGVEESIDVTREIELNNPFSLLDYKWSEYELNNASWLLSNGAFHSGATYVAVYELLLKIKNGTETKDGVSVKLSTEAYADTDFVINTADTTFRLPIKVKLASGNKVAGNGMTLGFTDGTHYTAIKSSGNYVIGDSSLYGVSVGTTGVTGPGTTQDAAWGITTDPTKSGIETSSSGLKLYFYVGETIQDANVIAASQVLTEIANLNGYDYVVESYRSGTNWYRVYKSGWCEQGGSGVTSDNYTSNKTITFLVPFKDTDYTLEGVGFFIDSIGAQVITAVNKKVTGFTTTSNTRNAGTNWWRACGYIR